MYGGWRWPDERWRIVDVEYWERDGYPKGKERGGELELVAAWDGQMCRAGTIRQSTADYQPYSGYGIHTSKCSPVPDSTVHTRSSAALVGSASH
jgi:hypothetical protein